MAASAEQMHVPLPCYATTLNTFAAFGPIRTRQNALLHTLDDVLGLLRARASAEESYAKSLQRVSQQAIACVPSTLGDALEGLRSDVVNRSVQHAEFSKNIFQDVYTPLSDLRSKLARKIKSIGNGASALQKDVRTLEDRYRKAYRQFSKAQKEAEEEVKTATSAGLSLLPEVASVEVSKILDGFKPGAAPRAPSPLVTIKESPATKTPSKSITQSLKSGLGLNFVSKAASSTGGDVVNWLLPSEELKREHILVSVHQKIAEAEQLRRLCMESWRRFVDVRKSASVRLQILLTEAQALEEDVLQGLQDTLRQHAVFESSALANQQYDVQMIFKAMEAVDWQLDLMMGMNSINNTLHADSNHDAEVDLGYLSMGMSRSPMPSPIPVALTGSEEESTELRSPSRSKDNGVEPVDPDGIANGVADDADIVSPGSGVLNRVKRPVKVPEPPVQPLLGLQLTDEHAQPRPANDVDLTEKLARADLPQVVCAVEDPNRAFEGDEPPPRPGPEEEDLPDLSAKITHADDVMRFLEQIQATQQEKFQRAQEEYERANASDSELQNAGPRLSVDDDEFEDEEFSDASPRVPDRLEEFSSNGSDKSDRLARLLPRMPQSPKLPWTRSGNGKATNGESSNLETTPAASTLEEETDLYTDKVDDDTGAELAKEGAADGAVNNEAGGAGGIPNGQGSVEVAAPSDVREAAEEASEAHEPEGKPELAGED